MSPPITPAHEHAGDRSAEAEERRAAQTSQE
jgi:hypothetical protein